MTNKDPGHIFTRGIKDDILQGVDISDNDIYEAMKDIHGYLDVTPADLKEIYRFAYRHALKRLTSHVKASDVMTADVLSAGRETTVGVIARMMAEQHITGVPVVETDRRVAGVISMKDLFDRMFPVDKVESAAVSAACLLCRGDIHGTGLRAEDIMTTPAITVRADTAVSEISSILVARGINRVPVTDAEGRLVGIITRSDIVLAMSVQGRVKTTEGADTE